MSHPVYGRAHAIMRARAPEWSSYTHHEFVRLLAVGDLPRDAFLHYLRQDYIFLQHFARAWALAAVKSASRSEMERAISIAANLILEETVLHVEICAKAGISRAALDATVERAENLAYTRFVLDAGYSGDLLSLLAALAPCVFGYGEIGARLMGQGAETYRPWIETYGGAPYQEGCAEVGRMLDDALVARFGPGFEDIPQFQSLCATFSAATRLEVGFWDMGLDP